MQYSFEKYDKSTIIIINSRSKISR